MSARRRTPEPAPTGDQAPEVAVVRSFERGLAVIRALSEPGSGQTLAEVARATGMTRAAARRFLATSSPSAMPATTAACSR